jgi:hypothetical protein
VRLRERWRLRREMKRKSEGDDPNPKKEIVVLIWKK